MTPVRFTRGSREMFALHLPARPTGAAARAVVLCNPFGQEAIRAHRLYRILGQRLAATGVEVLQFDYHGTGDSAGEDRDFDLDGAVLDTVAAAGLLRDRAGVRDVSFVGLRLGAGIAALAARQQPRGDVRVVLIDPVVDGVAYLRDLRTAHARALTQIYGARWRASAALRKLLQPSRDGREALGFELGEALCMQLAERLRADARWWSTDLATLLLSPGEQLCANWARGREGGRLEIVRVDDAIDWATNSALNTALVPMSWVQSILRFMAGESPRA